MFLLCKKFCVYYLCCLLEKRCKLLGKLLLVDADIQTPETFFYFKDLFVFSLYIQMCYLCMLIAYVPGALVSLKRVTHPQGLE